METLKEITKIFINLILWRKLKRETIETTCCLCDIGLMIKDLDMNILAMFCLNALSENEHTHPYIQKSCIDEGAEAEGSSSIFSRINYLLEIQEKEKPDDEEVKPDPKQELLIILITSFYLNLARNDKNTDFLLSLRLFAKLNRLMKNYSSFDSTALCYTNTIFAKLLKNSQARQQCIEEDGYELFIRILESNNKHLFLETLDSIKLFLTNRKYLSKFSHIPQCI